MKFTIADRGRLEELESAAISRVIVSRLLNSGLVPLPVALSLLRECNAATIAIGKSLSVSPPSRE